MRAFTAGNGSNSTSSVQAYLQSGRQFEFADLYLIGEYEDPKALFLTDWNSPLSWPIWGTFKPAVLQRGTVASQIGLEVTSLDLTWTPPIGTFGTPGSAIAGVSPYQLAQVGYYDNQRVRLWRAVMPTPGDANTYGACEFFGGWIAETEVARGSIKFKIDSFLNVVNQMVPPNVIESQNTFSQYAGATPVLADGETSVPSFTVNAGSSATVILATCIQPTVNKIYGFNKFAKGFIKFLPGSTLAGLWSGVATNGDIVVSGVHYNQFTVYTPFPYDPTPGDTFYASIQYPPNYADALSSGAQVANFPFVPDPETAL